MLLYQSFEVDPREFTLRRGGTVVPVQRQALATLIFLMSHAGHLVTRQQLLDGPWSGSAVSDAAIHRRILRARRLIELEGVPNPIETVRGIGFRFTGSVQIRSPQVHGPDFGLAPLLPAFPPHLPSAGGLPETAELTSRVYQAIRTLQEAVQLRARFTPLEPIEGQAVDLSRRKLG